MDAWASNGELVVYQNEAGDDEQSELEWENLVEISYVVE